MTKMYKRGSYNYGTGDDMIDHIEELVSERDTLAARLAEVERQRDHADAAALREAAATFNPALTYDGQEVSDQILALINPTDKEPPR